MTVFWLWWARAAWPLPSAGSPPRDSASAGLRAAANDRRAPRRSMRAAHRRARSSSSRARPSERAPAPRAAPPRRRAAAVKPEPAPAPTAPRPEAEKLALWARQVVAGERKMSVATDGCRVTWNRTCKHGHPTWLVYLGYLKRREPPKRHNPR